MLRSSRKTGSRSSRRHTDLWSPPPPAPPSPCFGPDPPNQVLPASDAVGETPVSDNRASRSGDLNPWRHEFGTGCHSPPVAGDKGPVGAAHESVGSPVLFPLKIKNYAIFFLFRQADRLWRNSFTFLQSTAFSSAWLAVLLRISYWFGHEKTPSHKGKQRRFCPEL